MAVYPRGRRCSKVRPPPIVSMDAPPYTTLLIFVVCCLDSNLSGTQPCRPPKVFKKQKTSQVIRPGASLPSFQPASILRQDDPITEFPNVDYDLLTNRNRSTRASSTQRSRFGNDSQPVAQACASQQEALDRCRRGKVDDDHRSAPLQMTLRKRPVALKSSPSSIIEIDSSSDDESLVEPPKVRWSIERF